MNETCDNMYTNSLPLHTPPNRGQTFFSAESSHVACQMNRKQGGASCTYHCHLYHWLFEGSGEVFLHPVRDSCVT